MVLTKLNFVIHRLFGNHAWGSKISEQKTLVFKASYLGCVIEFFALLICLGSIWIDGD